MQLKRRESAENRQYELRKNAIERHASSVATPWSLPGRSDRPFSRKISGFSCDLTALRKIKQLRINAVETRLGVTGLQRSTKFMNAAVSRQPRE